MKKLYLTLIAPKSVDPDTRNRELVLNYVLVGMLVLATFEMATSLFGFIALHQSYILYRLLGMLGVFIMFSSLYWLARRHRQQSFAAMSVTVFLFGLTTLVISEWGTVTPTGILLFSLVIVMAGILLGSRYALYAALSTTVILAIFEYLKVHGVVVPNLTWMQRPSSMSDIFGFGIIYAIIALVSWLYNQQMEQSLRRARKSETALQRQKDNLEETVKERTRQLELAQLEKLQQVYRFAELGRISSALFHDLANHLSSVSLDIEGLNRSQKSSLMKQVQNDIGYIDEIVQRVRLQLRGQGSVERFEVVQQVKTVAKTLNYKLVQSGIKFELQAPARPVYFKGDVIPFRQIISNLLGNAIEAYANESKNGRPKIIVTVTTHNKIITITVQDWGKGIKPGQQAKIFEPFYSSKTDGTGIGLFIVKQIVEHDLKGTIHLSSNAQSGTLFTVTIPQSRGR